MTGRDETREEEEGTLEKLTVSGPEATPRGSCLRVDKEMLRVKLHFFMSTGTFAVTMPFVPIIVVTGIGLTGSSLGFILICQQMLYIFINPLIGYLTDYFNKLKVIICVLTYLFVVPTTLLLTVPPIPSNENCQLLAFNELGLQETIELRVRRVERSRDLIVEVRNSSHTFPCLKDDDLYLKELSAISENMSCPLSETDQVLSNVPTTNVSSLIHMYVVEVLNDTLHVKSAVCCKSKEVYRFVVCDTTQSKQAYQFSAYQFWAIGLCVAVAQMASSASLTLSDTACCEMVQKKKADFGRQRLFWCFGFSAMVTIAGLLYDLTGSYTAAFVLMWIISIITVWNLTRMDLVKPSRRKNILSHVGTVLTSKDFLVFLFGILINGMGLSISRYYHILFLSTIGASRLLCGVIFGIQKLIEVPFLFYSGLFLRRLGHFHVLFLCVAAYFLRFLCLSYLHRPWVAIPIELIQGVSGGLIYPAATSYAKIKSKPGAEATTQTLVFATFDGLGMGLGSVLFGLAYDNYGGHLAFFYASLLFAGGAFVHLILTFLVRPKTEA